MRDGIVRSCPDLLRPGVSKGSMSPSSRLHYRLARSGDALAIGRLARRVTRRWILPDLPSSAAPRLLAGGDLAADHPRAAARHRPPAVAAGAARRRAARRHAAFHLKFLGHGGARIQASWLRARRAVADQCRRPDQPADAAGAGLMPRCWNTVLRP